MAVSLYHEEDLSAEFQKSAYRGVHDIESDFCNHDANRLRSESRFLVLSRAYDGVFNTFPSVSLVSGTLICASHVERVVGSFLYNSWYSRRGWTLWYRSEISSALLYMEADSLRMASTLGNSLYLGAYALIHIFISLFLFFQSKNNLARLFCFFVSIFSIYLLLASASRGVTLAAIICALGLGSMATLIVSNDRVRMLIRTIVISGIGAAFLVTILLYSPAGKKVAEVYLPIFAQKLIYKSLNDPMRISLWEICLKGLRYRPLTGWGLSNFDYINSRYIYDVNRVRVTNPWNDQSHNQIVDMFAMTGLFVDLRISACGPLFLYCYGKYVLIQFERAAFFIGIIFAFAAYFLQNLTVFESPGPVIVLYLLMAVTVYFVRDKSGVLIETREEAFERRSEREGIRQSSKQPFPTAGFILLPALIAVSGTAIFFLNYSHFQLSKKGITAIRILESGDIVRSTNLFKEVFASNSFVKSEFREQLTGAMPTVLRNPRFTAEQKRQLATLSLEESKKNLAEHPRNFRFFLRLMQAYRDFQVFDPSSNDRVAETAQKALILYPNRFELYKDLAESAATSRKFPEAIDYAKKAVEFDPIKVRSLWYLAIIYAQADEVEKSVNAAWDALMDDCNVYVYTPYFAALAESFPATLDNRALEFFTTMAVAYGRKDPTFMYAGRKVLIRANQLQTQSSTASIPTVK